MKKRMYGGILLLVLFGAWTYLVQTVDVRMVNETRVGFAAVNAWFHDLTGVCWWLYHVTDGLGLAPMAVCMVFAGLGLCQWVRRGSMAKVDADILLLGGYYAAVIACYLAFERFPVNFRPVLINGVREASYPSSTTLLVLSVMPSFVFQADRRLKNPRLKRGIRAACAAFCVLMVFGRLLSGVHWLTDIVGAVLLSAGLFTVYKAAVLRWEALHGIW